MHFLHDTYKIYIFFLSFFFGSLNGSSANLPDSLINSSVIIRSFEANKVINSSPNYSILFDHSGIMYLGQEDKINIYNSFSWSEVHLKGEILLSINELNTVFFFSENTLGFLSPDSSLKIEPKYLNSFLPEKFNKKFKAIDIKSTGKTIFFQTDSSLLSFNSKKFKTLDSDFSDGQIFKCGINLIAVKSGNNVSVFDENSNKTNFILPCLSVIYILEHKKGYLLVTKDNRFIITNTSFEIIEEWSERSVSNLCQGILLNSNEYLFSDDSNTLFLCDQTGHLLSKLNTAFDIPTSTINGIVQEASGNIWVIQEKAITRIEYPSAVGVISSLPNYVGNIRDIKSFDNKIFIAATKGLFYLDLKNSRIIATSLTGFCYQMIPTSHGVFAFTNNEVFLVNSDLPLSIYKGKLLDQSWNEELHRMCLSESNKLTIVSFKGNSAIDSYCVTTPITPLKIASLNSEIWISDGGNLYQYKKIESSDVEFFKHEIPDSIAITELFVWQNTLHILSEDKIYSYTNNTIKYERSLSNILITGEFLSVTEDSKGNLWFLFKNEDKNNVIWFGNIEENTFTKVILPSYISLTNPCIDYIGSNKIVLSSGMQIFIVDLKFYDAIPRKFETILKEIVAGNQILFKGISYDYFRVPMRTKLNEIPYNQNNIKIQLSSTNYLDNKVKFQYLLSGEGAIWSEWSSNSFLIFNDLNEGLYDLKIRSKDYLNETSEVTTLIFRISPPFYRTLWAYMLYFVLLGILSFIAYKTYLVNIHKAQGMSRQRKSDSNNPNQIPIIVSNIDPASVNKKYDFFSNIDEEKTKDKTRWDKYEMVTVLFSDIQGFTKIAESMNPELLIDELDRFFFHFDSVVEKYNIEKIKTIGDAYMAAGGIPQKSITNPIEVVLAALEMQNYMKQLKKTKIDIWDLRIGIHSGPVIAGIIGHKKRSFDIWGDTVNTASRMESTGEAGKVNISSETYKLVKEYFICEYRGKLPVKYKGNIDMYFVKGLRPELSINLVGLPNRKFFLKLQVLRLTDLEEFIMAKLETELDKNLFFHNYEYSRHLFEYSGLLSKATDLDLEETLFLRTAALLSNIGFIGGYDNHENRSADYAGTILPDYNYSEKQITIIRNLIISTKWPPEPKNLLEMVLYDTKMEYIGRADFIQLYKLLFLEQNNFQKSIDVLEFKRKQLEIIQNYTFFTDSAKRLREVSFGEQLQRIKDDDWK